jgi:hypothetical protein
MTDPQDTQPTDSEELAESTLDMVSGGAVPGDLMPVNISFNNPQ